MSDALARKGCARNEVLALVKYEYVAHILIANGIASFIRNYRGVRVVWGMADGHSGGGPLCPGRSAVLRNDLSVKEISNDVIDLLGMGDGSHMPKAIELPDLNAWQGTRQESRYPQRGWG